MPDPPLDAIHRDCGVDVEVVRILGEPTPVSARAISSSFDSIPIWTGPCTLVI
jgi:sensor domain CHASE-containing protein